MILRLCPLLEMLEMKEMGLDFTEDDEPRWISYRMMFGDVGDPDERDQARNDAISATPPRPQDRYRERRFDQLPLATYSGSFSRRGFTLSMGRHTLVYFLMHGDDDGRFRPTRISLTFPHDHPSKLTPRCSVRLLLMLRICH